ncbi:MAG: hypothetical protein PQ964_08110 [Methanobacteriaceae archaeon]|jgi:hypothetical protein
MRPETEAKVIIALVISLIAFGCGLGAGIIMGLSQNNTLNATNINITQRVPVLPQITRNVNIPAEPQNITDQDNIDPEPVYVENIEPDDNNVTQRQRNNATQRLLNQS